MLTEFFSREEQKSKKAGSKLARIVNQSPLVSPSHQMGGNDSVIFHSPLENRSRTPHRLQPLKLQSPGANEQPSSPPTPIIGQDPYKTAMMRIIDKEKVDEE